MSFSAPVRARRAAAMVGVVGLLAAVAALARPSASATAAAPENGAGGLEEKPGPGPSAPSPSGSGRGRTAFDRQGMWIWYVSRSQGGSVAAIIAQARRAHIGTVYVKSGDGATVWNQFNKSLIGPLHRAGIDVCAWQFVYGNEPVAEANVGAVAVHRGADCLVIDAEADYEGKYASADLYIRTLRAKIGANFPLSLSGFPYVDYHPAFPYSVFLGPGGAQYNQPQMYWKAIETSV
ncbi:MAG: hypothetical protein JST31_09655, partial [Actinobacteria bacterium]|nr:hypothetical protein [Actinomycetota bacterium]